MLAEGKVQEALIFCVECHVGQWREGPLVPGSAPLPYAFHPIEVTGLVSEVGLVCEPVMICAALLHDTMEESGVSEALIREKFCTEVSVLVYELTRYEPNAAETKGLTKDEIWQLRSDTLLREIAAMSARAKTIKLADRISNLREAFKTKKGKKLERYLRQTETILEIIPRPVNPPLWELLRQTLDRRILTAGASLHNEI